MVLWKEKRNMKNKFLTLILVIFSMFFLSGTVYAEEIYDADKDSSYSEYGSFKYKMTGGGINTYDGNIFYGSSKDIDQLENIIQSMGYILLNTDASDVDESIRNDIKNSGRFSYSDYLDKDKPFYWNMPLYIPGDWYTTFINCNEDDKPFILNDLSLLAVIIDRQMIKDRELSGTEGVIDDDIPVDAATAEITFISREDCNLYFWGGMQLRQYHIHVNANEPKTVKVIQDVYVLKEINGKACKDKRFLVLNKDNSLDDYEAEINIDFDVDKTIEEIEKEDGYIKEETKEKNIFVRATDSLIKNAEKNKTLSRLITCLLILVICIVLLILIYEHRLDEEEKKQDERDLENTKDSEENRFKD